MRSLAPLRRRHREAPLAGHVGCPAKDENLRRERRARGERCELDRAVMPRTRRHHMQC